MVLDDEENGGIDYEDYDVSDFFDDDDEDEEDDLEEYPQEDEETFEPQWFENGLDSDHIPTLVLVKQSLRKCVIPYDLLLNLV